MCTLGNSLLKDIEEKLGSRVGMLEMKVATIEEKLGSRVGLLEMKVVAIEEKLLEYNSTYKTDEKYELIFTYGNILIITLEIQHVYPNVCLACQPEFSLGIQYATTTNDPQ
ncbi:hypothetical protein IEQ34_019955 [Dendrobium chrysotoxum]|uniref:Uncharacterized protein n=1 Tax=Dendrobium chrysotoxum TaxID=161865 RepID=A0AAV7G8C1_DENCH|nr:hypothetical protein IEQ34_019955 [Dendrobium chrysotoxum]